MKILVLGKGGQLGNCLVDQFFYTNHEVIFFDRLDLDICDFLATSEKICDIKPDIVINATAYTAVDDAESNKVLADQVNNLAVENLAKTCLLLNAWLIHISTDYVFDGALSRPYLESDPTNPSTAYGVSKLKGELAIDSSGCKYLIIRTAWVFSEYGGNFLKTMLRLGAERDELSIVCDQIGCPTYAQDLARSIISIIPFLSLKKTCSGVFHYCGDQTCSWFDFAKAIFKEAELRGIKIPNTVSSINTSAYPTPATRPPYSVLDCSHIKNTFKLLQSDWRLGIQRSLDKLNN